MDTSYSTNNRVAWSVTESRQFTGPLTCVQVSIKDWQNSPLFSLSNMLWNKEKAHSFRSSLSIQKKTTGISNQTLAPGPLPVFK